MIEQAGTTAPTVDLARGLPQFAQSAPEALAKEKAEMAALQNQPALTRWKSYWAKTGPAWMQSAMTLGGGSAFASLFAGAYLQYKLLWVQPVAMILGIIMLSAMSHQTLSTGARPFHAMRTFIHPALAWAWALGTLAASIIWHFPQYALVAGMGEDIVEALTGWQPSQVGSTIMLCVIGALALTVAIWISWNYSSGRKGIKLFENIIKFMIWGIIVCFLIVIVRKMFSGGIEWGKVFAGFIPTEIPTDKRGVSVVMAAFGAAIGINMTFLLGYSYLARGWGKEHRGLARFDLVTGMLIPYTLATSLMVIVAGSTIYDPAFFAEGSTKLSPIKAAAMIEAAGIPMVFSRLIFGLGIMGMAINAITIHMLVCGFAACEIFGIEPGGRGYKLCCLIPVPGVFGVVLWQYMGAWIAIPTSAICGLMLPIAYVGVFALNNSQKYLGDDKPTGTKALVWNIAMLVAIVVSVAAVGYYLVGLATG